MNPILLFILATLIMISLMLIFFISLSRKIAKRLYQDIRKKPKYFLNEHTDMIYDEYKKIDDKEKLIKNVIYLETLDPTNSISDSLEMYLKYLATVITFVVGISVTLRKDFFNSTTNQGNIINNASIIMNNLSSFAAIPILFVSFLIALVLITRGLEKMTERIISIHLTTAKQILKDFEIHHPLIQPISEITFADPDQAT